MMYEGEVIGMAQGSNSGSAAGITEEQMHAIESMCTCIAVLVKKISVFYCLSELYLRNK